MTVDALSSFSPRVRDWFASAFAAPTAAQEQAWPAIASGEHVLLSAPTGSGKTLAAFLWALDKLSREAGENATRLVYVSPLKALSYDVERNLRAPLRGIGADLRVGLRTGDTPQRERAAMRRHPPDILITTPESLYLILTSQARDDAHLGRGGDRRRDPRRRLDQARRHIWRSRWSAWMRSRAMTCSASACRPRRTRWRRSGRFMVGPRRRCRVIDAGVRKPLDLRIQVPVESMVEPDATPAPELDPLVGRTEATRRSIWPAIYPQILDLVREHRSTIVFVNNRRGAERLALRLNELADADIARAHHGSLAREERTVVEELLKAGELPCLVATSSLELGIDMGAVDLVLQVESPKSVASGLQRIGRAGHNVGDVSKGRIFPKFRADLLECAVVARLMREGQIEPTVVPRNPLDVLAQQIVAIAASAPDEGVGGGVSVDDLYALVTATHSFAELLAPAAGERARHARRALPVGRVRRAAPAHRVGPRRAARSARARAPARWRSPTRARSPTGACSRVTLPDGRRVGELDEEMVYEARAGADVPAGRLHRGASRRSAATGSSSPRRRACRARCRSGAATASGARRSWGAAIGAFARWAVDQPAEVLERDYDLDELAARNLLDYLREQQEATRVDPERPHGRRRALPRRDRRLAPVRAVAVRRPRARRLGAGALRADPRGSTGWRPTRSGPTTGSSSTSPTPTSRRARTWCSSSPTSWRTSSSPSWAPARCSARASARTPAARCSSRAPTRAGARRCGSSG